MREIVLDTETTGFEPSEGHRIVEIGALELFNHLPTGRTYHQYINPERGMPAGAFEVHGIGHDILETPGKPVSGGVTLRDKPVFARIGQAFLDFIGEAQLVIHNAAFDMKFLKLKEQKTGVRFGNPVLDTLLLSGYLHDYTDDHNLDAIADRLGVDIHDRHTALGDSLVTAQVFLKLLDLLEAQGIQTLGQALEASDKMVEIRKTQANF